MEGVQDSTELLSAFLKLDVNVLQGENRPSKSLNRFKRSRKSGNDPQ